MIDLITYNQKTVRADYDATLYDQIIGTNCVLQGMELNLYDTGNKIKISNGFGIIRGRLFKVEEEELTVESLPGELNEGQVIIRIDLENTANPIEFLVDKTNRPLESSETQYATFTLDGLGGIASKRQTLKRFYSSIKSLSTNIKTTDEAVNEINTKLKTRKIELNNMIGGLTYTDVQCYVHNGVAFLNFLVTNTSPIGAGNILSSQLPIPKDGKYINSFFYKRQGGLYPNYITDTGQLKNGAIEMPAGRYSVNMFYLVE